MSIQSVIQDIAESAEWVLGEPVALERVLPGGTHATTVVLTCGGRSLVARRFPAGDDAVRRECAAHPALAHLGELVPQVVAVGGKAEQPVIVTTLIPGTPPAPDLPVPVIAVRMARILARIHALPGTELPLQPTAPMSTNGPLADRARTEFAALNTAERVLTHGDFWCGNLLWDRDMVTGVVDWSGAGNAPRGVDLAWCRQDLVLLGDPAAADLFLTEYEETAGVAVADITAWDVQAAARAEDRVETWAPNYLGIGRSDATPEMLRARLDTWNATL